jgi:hypothetical protein
MNLLLHALPESNAAEVISTALVITCEQDVITLLEELYGLGANKIILHQENLPAEFFELRTRLAGEILQKFGNYHIQVAIIGDFSQVSSKSLRAFIAESNRGTMVFFVDNVAAALNKFSCNY